MRRANYVGAPHFYALNQACRVLVEAFGHCIYLVGSSIERRDYRDVDVRAILEDDQYARMFPNGGGWTDAYWSIVVVSISHWLSKQTGLPIDFQIQQQTAANAEYPGASKRHALGIFFSKREESGGPHNPGC